MAGKNAGKRLYRAVLAGDHRIGDVDADAKGRAEAIRARLRAVSLTLYPSYEAAQNAGDVDKADAIDDVLSRLDILRISIGQAIVRYLDDAADVTAAQAAIDAVNDKLDAAAKGSDLGSHLDGIAAVLTELTKLVGWATGKGD